MENGLCPFSSPCLQFLIFFLFVCFDRPNNTNHIIKRWHTCKFVLEETQLVSEAVQSDSFRQSDQSDSLLTLNNFREHLQSLCSHRGTNCINSYFHKDNKVHYVLCHGSHLCKISMKTGSANTVLLIKLIEKIHFPPHLMAPQVKIKINTSTCFVLSDYKLSLQIRNSIWFLI